MGLPAARMTDVAGHGGMIILGAVSVLINGLPAARVGDPLACPGFDGPKPHVMGNIIKGSSTVQIGGAFAARMSDMTGCGVAGVSGQSMPALVGPPVPGTPGALTPEEGAVFGKKNAGALYGKKGGYSNAKGAGRDVQGSAAHVAGEKKIGGSTFSGSVDSVTGKAEAHGGYGGGGASAGVSGLTAQGKMSNADGSSVGGTVGVANANVGVDLLAGSDGRRTGVAIGASAQASLVEGQADSTAVYNIPFTNSNIQVGTTAGGSAGSIGAAGALGAYHDNQDNRHHAIGMVDVELLLGLKFGMDISFGQKSSPPLPPPISIPGVGIPLTPGAVMIGSVNVFIG